MRRRLAPTLLVLGAATLGACSAAEEVDASRPELASRDAGRKGLPDAVPFPDAGRADAGDQLSDRPVRLFGLPVSWIGPIDVNARGLTEGIRIDAETSTAVSLWVQLDADCDGRCCVQLTEVDVEGESIVPRADERVEQGQVCQACRSRVRVAQGAGFFTLPNDGHPLAGRFLDFRAQARDCETYLPLDARFGDPLPDRVWVGVVRHPAPRASPEVAVRVLVARDALSDGALHARVHGAFEVVQRRFAAAGFRFSFTAEWIDPLGKLKYESARLDGLERMVPSRPSQVLVVWVPCLERIDSLTGERSEPRGLCPRIPGGVPYDVIWVATRSCPLSGEGLGVVLGDQVIGTSLAHELGHYFGLYHAVEADGSPDHLEDTDASNFMNAVPSRGDEAGLSPLQAAVVRQHVALGR